MTEAAIDHITWMTELYAAFGRGDLTTMLAAMDEGIEWYEAEGHPWYSGHPYVGPQQILLNIIQRIGAEFDGFQIRPARFLCDGDTVIMEGRYRATSHHATGKPLDAQVVHIWDLRNGKVTRLHQYVDTRQLADIMAIHD